MKFGFNGRPLLNSFVYLDELLVTELDAQDAFQIDPELSVLKIVSFECPKKNTISFSREKLCFR